MSELPKLSVAVDNLPENERLIFKLIFSVSERSKKRTHHYLLSEADAHADIIVSSDCASHNAEAGVCCLQVVNELPVSAADEYIQRPLIATRVLASLDKYVKAKDLLNKPVAEEVTPDNEQPAVETEVAAATESIDEMMDFSISEEEASELAIVHDDTLSNPANAEETAGAENEQEQEVEAAVAETVGSNVETLQLTDKSTVNIAEVEVGNEAEVETKPEPTIPTALVVDDSASVRKQLEIELDLFEVQVDFAEDAERAFDLLDSKPYDVAFLDVVLPDKDGFQICKKIKTNNDMKNTKVVMLTGKASHADKVRGSLAGCDAYLVKPVGRSTFQTTVKKYLTPVENVEVMEA